MSHSGISGSIYRLILEAFPKHLAAFVASIPSCTYSNIVLLPCTVITSRLPPSPHPNYSGSSWKALVLSCLAYNGCLINTE